MTANLPACPSLVPTVQPRTASGRTPPNNCLLFFRLAQDVTEDRLEQQQIYGQICPPVVKTASFDQPWTEPLAIRVAGWPGPRAWCGFGLCWSLPGGRAATARPDGDGFLGDGSFHCGGARAPPRPRAGDPVHGNTASEAVPRRTGLTSPVPSNLRSCTDGQSALASMLARRELSLNHCSYEIRSAGRGWLCTRGASLARLGWPLPVLPSREGNLVHTYHLCTHLFAGVWGRDRLPQIPTTIHL
jgi:hypothetical protein